MVLSGQQSTPLPINASVPQGSILGPLLFSTFIDDLVDLCKNEVYMYADDVTLFKPVTTSEAGGVSARSLNADLAKIHSWADRWKVTFEPTKCKSQGPVA